MSKFFVPSYFVSRDMFFLTDLDKEWPSCFVTVIPLCLWCDVVASLCCSTIFCDSGELETALSAGAMATSVTLLLSRVRRTVSRAVSWCHAQCHTCHVTPSPTWTPAQSFTIAITEACEKDKSFLPGIRMTSLIFSQISLYLNSL